VLDAIEIFQEFLPIGSW
jgi:hypothetical protein